MLPLTAQPAGERPDPSSVPSGPLAHRYGKASASAGVAVPRGSAGKPSPFIIRVGRSKLRSLQVILRAPSGLPPNGLPDSRRIDAPAHPTGRHRPGPPSGGRRRWLRGRPAATQRVPVGNRAPRAGGSLTAHGPRPQWVAVGRRRCVDDLVEASRKPASTESRRPRPDSSGRRARADCRQKTLPRHPLGRGLASSGRRTARAGRRRAATRRLLPETGGGH